MRVNPLLLLAVVLVSTPAVAIEFTGRFSMLGTTAEAKEGDLGYQDTPGNILTADQQSLRLMAEQRSEEDEWSVHLRTLRLHSDGLGIVPQSSSALFRYAELGGDLIDESDGTESTRVHYELDRLFYRHHFDNTTLTIGREAIDWGSGRFWQPLNVFGSFSPTDLDTDYKPGIDLVSLDYYPSPFSSLSAVYALAPEDQSDIEDSAALYYRRQVGERSEMGLLSATISGNNAFGASFESAWGEIGWRIEAGHYEMRESDEQSLFWIAGIEYQFDNGTLLELEYYDNSRGATTEAQLATAFTDELVLAGVQQHLSRQLVGLGLARDLSPLWHGGYTLLASAVDDDAGERNCSFLHQLNLTYSVSNESDLLFSLMLPTGKGVSALAEPRSEFGHLPASLTLRLRFYF